MDGRSLRAVGWARSLPLNSQVKTARDWARSHLDELGWTDAADETADDVLLVVSELVTNAQIHAHSTAQLVMSWDSECLHIAVHDTSPELPAPRQPDTLQPGGGGILLMNALAESWEARPCPHGKTVIACFRPPSPADDGHRERQ
ncbi:ATP-binding protein [Streptomyces dangxiongensis]|uniref:ATP-binding protein n=1 Tax=Streptomyces dangxiongensis TaxID=1442032 RepID=A0A3G2JM25_9ACTN|nr:ATP-binding protein [Streptomyces dangxiongensis]AYN43490.1 ATP-binding protein [Streptomyces dangxiongensis]